MKQIKLIVKSKKQKIQFRVKLLRKEVENLTANEDNGSLILRNMTHSRGGMPLHWHTF